MLRLTKKQAITKHRKMWNWIADYLDSCEPEKLPKNIVGIKFEYFTCNNVDINNIPKNYCYCCEYCDYVDGVCSNCPIDWRGSSCFANDGLYTQILSLDAHVDSKLMSKLARQIANLPESGD